MQQNRRPSESGIESIHSEESLGNPSNHSFIGWLTAATDIWGLYPPNHLATCICIYSDFSRRQMTMHGTFLLKAPHRTSPDGFRTCRATLYNNNHHRRRSQVRVCNVNWMTYGGKLWVTTDFSVHRKICEKFCSLIWYAERQTFFFIELRFANRFDKKKQELEFRQMDQHFMVIQTRFCYVLRNWDILKESTIYLVSLLSILTKSGFVACQ